MHEGGERVLSAKFSVPFLFFWWLFLMLAFPPFLFLSFSLFYFLGSKTSPQGGDGFLSA